MPENDGGWGNWSNSVVEADDATFLVNPREATRKAIERAGRDLAAQASANAAQQAAHVSQVVGVATQMDREFAEAHPELMGTDLERRAVAVAIGKCLTDSRFPGLLADPRMRGKVFDAVAKLANQELGRSDAAVTRRPSDQMADDLIRTPPERQRAAMRELVDLAIGSGRTGGGL